MSVSNDMLKKLALYGSTPVPAVSDSPQVRIILWGADGNIVTAKTIGRYPFDHETKTLTFPEKFEVTLFVSYADANPGHSYLRPEISKVSIETLSEQPPADYPSDVLAVTRSAMLPRVDWVGKWVVESTDSGQVSIRLPRLVEFSEENGVVSNSDTITIQLPDRLADTMAKMLS